MFKSFCWSSVEGNVMSFYDLGSLRVQFLTELCTLYIEYSGASPGCFRAVVKWRAKLSVL